MAEYDYNYENFNHDETDTVDTVDFFAQFRDIDTDFFNIRGESC